MLKNVFCLLLTCIPAGLATCQVQQENKNESQRYLDPVFENVDVEKDIVFGEVVNYKGENENLTLDVYTPAGHMDDFAVKIAHFLYEIL